MSEIISLFALVVALASAFFTVKNYRVSVRPLLSIWQSTPYEEQSYHAITVKNCGNGPAIIESMKVFVDGDEVEGEGFDIFANAVCRLFALASGDTAAQISYVAFAGEGQPFGANEERDLIRFNIDPSFDDEGGDPIEVMDRARLEIIYRDMYGAKWKVKVSKFKTELEKLKVKKSFLDHVRSLWSEF